MYLINQWYSSKFTCKNVGFGVIFCILPLGISFWDYSFGCVSRDVFSFTTILY